MRLPSYKYLRKIITEGPVLEAADVIEHKNVLEKYTRLLLLLNYAFAIRGGLTLVELPHNLFVYDGEDWYIVDIDIRNGDALSEQLVFQLKDVIEKKPKRVYVAATIPGVLVHKRTNAGDASHVVSRVMTGVYSFARAWEIADTLYPLRPRCSTIGILDEKFRKRYEVLSKKKRNKR